MYFSFGFYSSILLIFFVHGFVYAILLWRKGMINETASDKWLSTFLFLSILYIAPWMLGFGGWYDEQPYRDILFYTPFQHLYFIGPVIFFYVQSLLNPSFRFGRTAWWHLLPGILYLLFTVIMVVTDKLVLNDYFFLANGADPDFDTWYQLTGFISMLFYFLLSIRYYNLYKNLIVQTVSYADSVLFSWIKKFLLAFLIMLCVRFVFFIIEQFTELWYADTWWYFLTFAILFYYVAISGYANSVETKVAFKPNMMDSRPALLLNYQQENIWEEDAEIIEIEPTDKEQAASDEVLNEWKPKLLYLLQVEKLYENPELTLTEVAKQLQKSPSFISMVVNRGFAQNFNDLVNQFRIEAVKQKLNKGEHKDQTLLGIAYDCGFNSKATFNRAFKKATGQNPKAYISGIK